MTVTISFRVSEELEEHLEQEAEKRMTTKSTVAQMLLAEHFRQISDESDINDTVKDTEERARKELDSMAEFKFASKTLADRARQEFPEYVSDEDDKRYKKVRFEAGTPGKIVEELERRNVTRLK
jgi:predicted transcriptional regulator